MPKLKVGTTLPSVYGPFSQSTRALFTLTDMRLIHRDHTLAGTLGFPGSQFLFEAKAHAHFSTASEASVHTRQGEGTGTLRPVLHMVQNNM